MAASTDFLGLLIEQVGQWPSPDDVVNRLVPEVADLAQVFVRQGDRIKLVAFRHLDPAFHPVLAQLAEVHQPALDHPTDPIVMVMRARQAVMSTWVRREDVERATSDVRVHEMFDAIKPRNIVIAPLERDGDVYGAIAVALSISSRRFMEGDLEFMRAFAQRVGPILSVERR